jgi:hypothetical protein
MDPKKLLPGALRAIGKIVGLGGFADTIASAIEGNSELALTPEQRAALDVELHTFEVQMRQQDTEQMKLYLSEALAEIQSADKFVSRARPTGYYAFVLGSLFYVALVGIISLRTGQLDAALVLATLAPLGGAGAQWQYNRTQEKKAKLLNGNGAR